MDLESFETERLNSTFHFPETLKQQQFEGYTPDPCPICRGALVNTWVILMCGHTYCMECFQKLLGKATEHIHCCVCRSKQCLQDVSYIKSSANVENTPADEINLVGHYSRKVEDVVKLILKLRKQDSHVKVLLFSTWPAVLKLLRKALEENDINVELADANSSFEKRIESFKDPLKKITVLLLPIRLGSKGLNLIEATHVVLLEPVLNPADELQAIGRVHRIGQTKPTFVHKFLIKNTIEESVYNATSSNAAGWERGRITIGQLKSLFNNTVGDNEQENNDENILRPSDEIEIVDAANGELDHTESLALESSDVNNDTVVNSASFMDSLVARICGTEENT